MFDCCPPLHPFSVGETHRYVRHIFPITSGSISRHSTAVEHVMWCSENGEALFVLYLPCKDVKYALCMT